MVVVEEGSGGPNLQSPKGTKMTNMTDMTIFHTAIEIDVDGARFWFKFEGADAMAVTLEARAELARQEALYGEGILSDWEEWEEPLPTSGEGWHLAA